MKYIVVSKVKQRARELGYRTSKSLLHELDIAVEILITRAGTWTHPRKTIKGDALAGYLKHHRIVR